MIRIGGQALEEHIVYPLHQIIKDKAKVNAKCVYFHSFVAKKSYPKGTIPSVNLKIMDVPDDLTREWTTTSEHYNEKLTLMLTSYHHR